MNNEDVAVEVPIKKYAILIFFNAVAFCSYFTVFVIELLKIYQLNNCFGVEHLFAMIVTLVFFMSFMWLTFGKEVVLFSGTNVYLIKSNVIFRIRTRYDVNKIKGFYVKEKKYVGKGLMRRKQQEILEKKNALLFWNDMGELYFMYDGKVKTFFNGLSNDRKDIVVSDLNNELKKRLMK